MPFNSVKIAKLLKAVAKRKSEGTAESRPGEGKELAEEIAGAKAGRKKSRKKMKKVLDKADSM